MRRVRAGHADSDYVFLTQCVDGDSRSECRIDTAAEPKHDLAEAAFSHVIAGTEHQSCIGAGFDALVTIMNIPGKRLRIEADHVFFERLGLRDDLPVGTEREARSVEHQAIVATNLVHHGNRNAIMPGDSRQHVLAKFALAQVERRSRDVQQNLPARPDEVLHRIDAVEATVPEVLVVPGVLADGQRARSIVEE